MIEGRRCVQSMTGLIALTFRNLRMGSRCTFGGMSQDYLSIRQNAISFDGIATRLGDILDFGQLFKAFGNN